MTGPSVVKKRGRTSQPRDTGVNQEAKLSLITGEQYGQVELMGRHDDRIDGQRSQLRGDYGNIMVLLFLYVLQGIPLGLAGSIPLILQNKKVSYSQQAIFSFVSWPFSVKLLWAPIVDSLYSSRFGRRKSWLVPVQYLIGLFMMVLSSRIDGLLGGSAEDLPAAPGESVTVESKVINIYMLTGVFIALNFLAATQDIAVDGWALTMLSRRNVGYASTCNTVGQTTGFFLGNVVFLALESPEFCNKFLRSVPATDGLVTLSGFLHFWGIVFVISTTLVALLKRETEPTPEKDEGDGPGPESEPELGIVGTYQALWQILRLPAVQLFCVVLLTCKIGFGVSDSVTGLKLMEAGLKKEHLALLAVPMVPLQIILPWIIAKYTSGPRPLDIFLKMYIPRLLFGFVFCAVLYSTYLIRNEDGSFPLYYYGLILIVYAFHQITVFSIYVALMAFHAKKSDPAIGGTYMTLLNTVTNLGGNWPATASLSLVEHFDIKDCTIQAGKELCTKTIDGYYILSTISITLGFLWLILFGYRKIQKLQSLPPSAWKCSGSS